MIRIPRFLFLIFVFGFPLQVLYAQSWIDDIDVKVRYSRMKISEAKVGDITDTNLLFFRDNVEFEVGFKQAIIGLAYQKATKDEGKTPTPKGKEEDGVMLTAGYDRVLSERFRLEAYGRLGIYGDTDSGQPLYATDTDIRLNLVMFHSEGMGLISYKAIYPSSYVGVIVNKFGRVQSISGVGLWWNGIGAYFTGYKALNGVVDPRPGKFSEDEKDIRFANLKNSGFTVGFGYDFRDFKIWVRRNFPYENSGNDITYWLQYRYFFRKERL